MPHEKTSSGGAVHRPWAVRLAFTVIVASAVIPILVSAPNSDVAWIVYCAERMVTGLKLYVDLMEVNPPLIVFLTAIPTVIAQHAGLPAVPTFYVAVTITASAILVFTNHIARAHLGLSPSPRLFLLLLEAVVILPLAGEHFGQREHLALMLMLPYLLVCVPTPAKRSERTVASRLIAGVLFGIGVAIKPYFIAVWLAVQVYIFVVKREVSGWIRIENVAIAGVGAVYCSAVWLVTPDYFSVVRWLAVTYDGYRSSASDLLHATALKIVLVVVAAAVAVRPSAGMGRLRWMLILGAVGFAVAAVVQRKGWSYHFYPALALAAFAGGLIVWDAVGRGVRGSGRKVQEWTGSIAMVGLVALSGVLGLVTLRTGQIGSELKDLVNVVQAQAVDGPIVLLSTSISPAFPLVTIAGTEWGMRYPHLWPLPGLYSHATGTAGPFPYHPRKEWGRLERQFVAQITTDLARQRPVLLLTDEAPWKQGFGMTTFDFVAYFERDPAFRAVMEDYVLLKKVGQYNVFRRIDSGGGFSR